MQGSRSAFATIFCFKFLDSSRESCGSALAPLKKAAMKATIYHNPKCGTSRKTLEILRDSGADVWIHEYLKNPPTRSQLEDIWPEPLAIGPPALPRGPGILFPPMVT